MSKVKWIIQDHVKHAAPDFNCSLPENEGGACVAEARMETGQNEANEDIRRGRVKRFDSPDDMIASLEQPW